jgi:hypothetical protein
MAATGGVLTPVGLAARPLDEEIADMWVPHRVVADSETLYSILAGGAFRFWTGTGTGTGTGETEGEVDCYGLS